MEKPLLEENPELIINESNENYPIKSQAFDISFTNKIQSFDEILNELGYGLYQLKLYLIISFLVFSEGSQVMVFTLMIPVLEAQWGVSRLVNSLQASLIFISFLIGSILSGQIADRYGRRGPIVVSGGLMTILSFLTAISPNIEILILLRVLLGLLVGFFGPLGATMLVELTPVKVRGKFMCLITMSMSLGQIFGICMAYFCLKNLTEGNWRLLIVLCTIPGAISWIFSIFYLDESPRYALIAGNYREAFTIINKINSQNNKKVFEILSENQKEMLKKWTNELGSTYKNEDIASIGALFKGKVSF